MLAARMRAFEALHSQRRRRLIGTVHEASDTDDSKSPIGAQLAQPGGEVDTISSAASPRAGVLSLGDAEDESSECLETVGRCDLHHCASLLAAQHFQPLGPPTESASIDSPSIGASSITFGIAASGRRRPKARPRPPALTHAPSHQAEDEEDAGSNSASSPPFKPAPPSDGTPVSSASPSRRGGIASRPVSLWGMTVDRAEFVEIFSDMDRQGSGGRMLRLPMALYDKLAAPRSGGGSGAAAPPPPQRGRQRRPAP